MSWLALRVARALWRGVWPRRCRTPPGPLSLSPRLLKPVSPWLRVVCMTYKQSNRKEALKAMPPSVNQSADASVPRWRRDEDDGGAAGQAVIRTGSVS
jgi:hypothetical protein